jgi:transposase
MTLHAGLDMSTRETAICVVDGVGSVVWEGKVPTAVEAIADALATRVTGLVRVGIETGPISVWLWHELRRAASPSIAFTLGAPLLR